MLFFKKKTKQHFNAYEITCIRESIFETLNENLKAKSESNNSQVHFSSKMDSNAYEILGKERTKSFGMVVYEYIRDKGISENYFYKKSGIGRKIFWSLMNTQNYQPSKKTAVQCALGLELSTYSATALLMKAGYALSDYIKWDVAIKYALDGRDFESIAFVTTDDQGYITKIHTSMDSKYHFKVDDNE